MSKILANEIANYGDDSPIDLKEGLNIPAGKPLQAAGSSGSAGQVLSTTGTSVAWVAGFDGNYNSLSNRPTIPAAQVNSDWNASGGVAVILNKPVVPPLPTVTTASASGGGSLAYNAGNGEFTFAPADLSNSSNWDTAFGWGDHSTAGYLTAEADTLASVRARNANTGGNIQFGDNQFAVFGASGDLSVGHTGAYSFVRETGVGNLALAADTNIDILNSSLNEYKARFITNGGVWLYYDNAIKLQTTPGGVSIGGDIALGSGNITTTGKLLYGNNYASTGDLPGASTYDGMFATAAGSAYYSASGNWTELLTSTALSSITLDSLSNVDLSVAPTNGQVLKWNGTTWAAANDLTGGGGGGLALTDLSVQSQTASGGGSLTYNNGSGVFTYTPPDLSGYLTSLGTALVDADFTTNGLMKRTADGVYTSTTDNSSNWDTAFGWGNHATQGYLTALPNHGLNTHTGVTLTSESAGQLLQYNGTAWVNWTPNYLTSETSHADVVVDSDFMSNGLMKRTAAGSYAIVADDSANWSTAYGWGNHASAGYLTTVALNNISDVTITTPSSGQVLSYNGSAWVNAASTGGASVTISDTPPAASPGDLWWESDTGRLKIRYQDTDSTQWVDVAPPLAPSLSSNAPATASSTGSAGDIRYDSGYVYICVATDTWKRAALATW